MLALWLACTSTPDAPEPNGPMGPEITGVFAEILEDLPTVGRVSWEQHAVGAVHLEFQADGGAWQQSPVRVHEVGAASELILGVPYDAEVEWRLVSDLSIDGGTGTLATGPWPDTLPHPIVLANDSTLRDPTAGWIVTSMNHDGDDRYGRWWIFVMDHAGQVVWAQDQPRDWISRHVSVAHDGGALLVDRSTYWVGFDGGTDSVVVRMTLDGVEHHTFATPGLHHSFIGLPDDRLAWLAVGVGSRDTLETVGRDGVQTRIWDCDDLHDAVGSTDVCGSNGLWWDASTDHFLASFWSTDTVVEIDGATGQTVRWFGDLEGAWGFEVPGTQFWWQHGPTYTPQGTLMVSTKDRESGDETMVREYVLDDANEQLVEVYSFGAGRGIYGMYMGEALRLPNGNTLHVYGAGGHMVEAMPDGSVAWEVTWDGDKHNGHTTPVPDLYALLDPG